jgi:hypothetical protein
LVYLLVLAGIPIGLLGAGAFNPDEAFLFQSEALWRVFGLYAYLGILAGPPLGLTLVVMGLRQRWRSSRA